MQPTYTLILAAPITLIHITYLCTTSYNWCHSFLKVLDRQVLRWLEMIREKSCITNGSPAATLLQDLRYTHTSITYTRHISLHSYNYVTLHCWRSDPNMDFIAVYHEPGMQNVNLMSQLAGLLQTVSTHEVTREAQLEIASTRVSMQIDSKMLLGLIMSYHSHFTTFNSHFN